jgi:hypothetical protein
VPWNERCSIILIGICDNKVTEKEHGTNAGIQLGICEAFELSSDMAKRSPTWDLRGFRAELGTAVRCWPVVVVIGQFFITGHAPFVLPCEQRPAQNRPCDGCGVDAASSQAKHNLRHTASFNRFAC